MLDNDVTSGSVTTTDDAKRTFAAESLAYNVKNNADFRKLFPELVELHEQKAAGAAPAPKPQPAQGASAPSPR